MPIDTLVFDFGGVIIDISDWKVVESMTALGVSHLKQLVHARQIKALLNQFVDGLVPMEQTLQELLALCREGTTREQVLDVVSHLCADLPVERLQSLAALRQRYKVYLLSNINEYLWLQSVERMRALGFEVGDCFDRVFLSYEMQKAKPDAAIYEQLIAVTGLDPSRTLYFEDRENNYEAGKAIGLQAVLVKTNHIETLDLWKSLNQPQK